MPLNQNVTKSSGKYVPKQYWAMGSRCRSIMHACRKNPRNLVLWPMTLIFNKFLEVAQNFIELSAAVHELSCY